MLCPVCRGASAREFVERGVDGYWRCSDCSATFLDPARRLGPEEERAHYQHHQNDPADPRYRHFLSKLSAPLLQRLGAGLDGLDYGCGPGPALAQVLTEAGHHLSLYDPFFSPEKAPLGRTYDFITCTEVAEHFHDPAAEFDLLDRLLRPGGWLGVMTCFQTEDHLFANWHYRKDPTHVVFYRESTFQVIAAQRAWSCECPAKDVVLMQKSAQR